MCIVIGKYFKDLGWVGIKNRDRNYTPSISFKDVTHKKIDITYFWDNDTTYCEGFNSNGISILSASLMVRDDEKEIKTKKQSKDGLRIKHALSRDNLLDVIDFLIEVNLTGHTLIFDQKQMYLLEGAWLPKQYKSRNFSHTVRKIPNEEMIVRTNHGLSLDWAGYQRRHNNEKQTLSRISSESRYKIAEMVVHQGESPLEIIDGLTKDYTGNWQLNATRRESGDMLMKTTSQTIIIPSELRMYVRPISCTITGTPDNNKIKILKKIDF